jgi:phage tail sheath protein FI
MLPAVPPPILGVPTSTTALIGEAAQGPVEQPVLITSLSEYEQVFGGAQPGQELFLAVSLFFLNGGRRAWVVRLGARSAAGVRRGLAGLDAVDDLGLLCLAGLSGGTLLAAAATYARSRGTFFVGEPAGSRQATLTAVRAIRAADRGHAAVFFPRLRVRDPLQPSATVLCGSSGAIAGLLARTDTQRGVHAFAVGTGAHVQGAVGLASSVGDKAAATLRRSGVNAIRQVPSHGIVVWGARTVGGGRERDEDWKYVPVRRTALYLEESIDRGIEWVDFEPNDEPTWRALRGTVATFLVQTFQEGAFAGEAPEEAFFVRCGSDTTTQSDIDNGVVVIEIGFAPFRPAEFVTFRIRHKRD